MSSGSSKSRNPLSRRRPNPLAARVLLTLGLVGCGLTLLGFTARWWWIGEVACHFRLQYLLGLTALAISLLWLQRPWAAVLAACGAATNLLVVAPLYAGTVAAAPSQRHSIRVVLANVYARNRRPAALQTYLESRQPDVAVLLEVTERWETALEPLRASYPFMATQARADDFGLAVLSRLPVEEPQVFSLGGPHGTPAITIRVALADHFLTIIGAHPWPPITPRAATFRNRQFAELAHRVRVEQHPVLLVGDLNTTSWSPAFGELLRRSGLRDTRIGFGVQPSWPAQIPWLRIPLDHGLASPDITVSRRTVGPSIGSDHYPVLLDLSFFSEPAA